MGKVDKSYLKYKHLFAIDNFCINFKCNVDAFIRTEHLNPKDKELAKKIKQLIDSATNGKISERIIFKNFIKNKLLTGIDLYEKPLAFDNATLLEPKIELNTSLDLLDWIIPFQNYELLTAQDKFEILLCYFNDEETNGYHTGFKNLAAKYSAKKTSTILNGFENVKYEYTEEDLDDVFSKEVISLSVKEKIDIIVQRIYQQIYGLDVVDILAYSDLNEIGISNNGEYIFAWCTEKIRLSFLKISEEKTRIIQDRAISFNENNGQLDRDNPSVICYRADNGRVLALQQPFSSARNLRIRLFNMQTAGFKDIVTTYKQQLLIQVLIRTSQKIILQGELGSGKTTAMKTLLEIIPDSLHIGTVEDTLEQHNRLMYPNKCIVEMQQTHNKTLMDAVMTLFRSSVDVASLGEARDGEALYSYIQLAQALGYPTLFTSHVASPEDTIPRCKNMLIASGRYFDEKAAVFDLIQYINIIFQHKIVNHRRVIEEIVEIVPLIEKHATVDYTSSNTSIEELNRLALIQQIQSNPFNCYRLNKILVYEKGEFVFKNYPSQKIIQCGLNNPEIKPYMEKLLSMIEEDIKRQEKEGASIEKCTSRLPF